MVASLPNIITPLIVLVFAIFLIARMRLFSSSQVGGRYLFLVGAIIVLVASLWQWVRLSPGYEDWFVPSAYTAIDSIQYVLVLIGAFLAVSGIAFYADFWQEKREDIDVREGKLSILENLQHDSREPYPILELLTIALKEIVYQLPGSAGAIFLVNRKRRQFILTSSSGLNKQEIAYLEYYPLERNIVSQSVELGDPMITDEFTFVSRDGRPVESRFRSAMVLPLISGMEKIGGILLFSEDEKFYRRSDIRFLAPVAEWLAEKIKSARLAREVSLSHAEVEKYEQAQTELSNRVIAASAAFAERDAVPGFCRALVGLISSDSVHLYGLKQGSLQMFGGSEPLFDLSESYKTALIDAIDREKPLIINQEGTDDDGRPRVVRSSLIVPFSWENGRAALLCRRDSVYKIDDHHLKTLEIFTRLASLLLARTETNRLAMTRRLGFDKVLELLQFDRHREIMSEPSGFIRHLADILPGTSAAITFSVEGSGALQAVSSIHTDGNMPDDFRVAAGEGGLGQAAATGDVSFVFGRANVTKHLERYEDSTRATLLGFLGERGTPSFVAYCPIARLDRVTGVAMILMYSMDEAERGEWERLLKLATGLYSLRQVIGRLQEQPRPEAQETRSFAATTVNQLNNFLSGIVGHAELASRDQGLSSEVREYITRILDEAEKAGELVKKSAGDAVPGESPTEPARQEPDDNLNETIRSVLEHVHISGELYMTGGRPRAITLDLQEVGHTQLAGHQIKDLFESVVNRFSAMVTEEDVITISTYQTDDFVYLDICRHRKNFPPVRPVATFGEYVDFARAAEDHSAEMYLKQLSNGSGYFTIDRTAGSPAYLSFKFPLKGTAVQTDRSPERPIVRVLAIDDEAIILDLISAMGQSMGYYVETASSGEEGVRLASASQFDIILTDLAMPGMSGLAVAREIRRRDENTPIILVTGWERTLDPQEISSAGITDILYKPFRIEQLTSLVQAASVPRK